MGAVKMGGFKWWHGVVIVAAIAAVAWGARSMMGSRGEAAPRLATEIILVDVTTGDLYSFDISGRRAVVLPEKNPETGLQTLLGVEKREDAKWYITGRQLPLLANVKAEPRAVLSRETGEVRVTSEWARKGR